MRNWGEEDSITEGNADKKQKGIEQNKGGGLNSLLIAIDRTEVVSAVKEWAISLNIETSIMDALAHTSFTHFPEQVTAHATTAQIKNA